MGTVPPSSALSISWALSSFLARVAAAGVSLLLRAGGGLYWLVPGVAFSLVVAVVNAWVLLVEVVR
jgi:hypothetical protein